MLFLRLDTFIGAIGLRSIYTILCFILLTIFLLTMLLYLFLWGIISGTQAIVFSILLVIGLVAVNYGLILIGWFTGIWAISLPPEVLLIGLLVALAVWVWQRSRPNLFRPALVKVIAIILLVFAAAYVIGIGSLPYNLELTSYGGAWLGSHHYILILYWGWLGDADRLTLYQCNQLALFCKEVNRMEGYYYRGKDIVLIPNFSANTLVMQVDGTTVSTYRP
jgi:hypothetical protein